MGNRRHRSQCVITVLALTMLAACTPATRAPVAPQPAVDVRAEAFRAGVRATLESYATQYLDNDFPYYQWQAPLVQQTWIPPQISGGVLIPGHLGYVTITPGAYKRAFAAPLTSHRSLMEQRPYVREHPPGWAEPAPTTPRVGAPVSSRAAPPAAAEPPAARVHEGAPSGRPWAALPPPSARWRGHE
jgi:hypothetical protein